MIYTVPCPGCGTPQRLLYLPGWPGTRECPPEPGEWDYQDPRTCACTLTPERQDAALDRIEALHLAARTPARGPLVDLPR